MSDSADLEVLEGFLCPICMMDLVTPTRLHSHFHEKHSEDLRVSKFVKGFMGQAKKILKQTKNGEDNLQKYNLISPLELYNEDQSVGCRRNHTEEFKAIRNKRMEGYAIETNKVLIRLDKLLLNMPSDPSKRKVHEQTTVAWLDGTDVTRCPNCTKTFHIVRRRHHCRLCGSIMCHDCSCFLPYHKARQLLSGTYEMNEVTENETDEEESLRLCEFCLNMVESRGRMQAARNADCTINELYNNLRDNIAQIDEHAALYEKMSLSLNDGKSKYNLADAQQFWVKILKYAEKIEAQSSKIATLNINKGISPRQLQLQKSVRMGVTDYIKSKILLLPKLPSEDEYAELQERRRKRVEERIKEEKEEVSVDILGNPQLKQERMVYKRSPVKARPQNNVKINDGWIPDHTNSTYNENPLIEQMNNIRNYIKQAREALKFDEVASLEEHLKELNEEYFRQSQLSPTDGNHD